MQTEISPADDILSSVERALHEDIGGGDATTDSIIPAGAQLKAMIIAKRPEVIAGLSPVQLVPAHEAHHPA